MPWIDIYLALGSNLADPAYQVEQAMDQLKTLPQCEWQTASSLYVSEPMGPVEQPHYINAVVHLKTKLCPQSLLQQTQAIEWAQGRRRDGQRWGPRTIDIDILLYGQNCVDLPELLIPHAGLTERNFVLYPLYEIAPDLTLPDGNHLRDLLTHICRDGLEIYRASPTC